MKIRHIPSKIKIAVLIVGSLFGIYAMLGFYLLPMLVKSKLPTLIQQETGRKASVAKVRFDPFSLKLSLQGFELQQPDGQLFSGFEDFFLDINALQSISQKALVIDDMWLRKPVVRIAKHQDGTFNFKDLIKDKNEAKQDGGKIFPVNIVKLSIAEGKLDWEDAHFKNPEKETVYPININIENFTTQADNPAKFGLTLELNSGGKLDWQGTIVVNSLSSSGHIKLDDVKLSRIRALAFQDFVQLDLQGYELFEADYKAAYKDNKVNVSVNQGKFALHDFQASATQDKALVKMIKLSVQGIGFNLENHELTIESVSANDADFKAWLNAEGVVNYQSFLPVAKTEESPVEPTQSTSWNININNIALNNCGLTFEDQTLKKPVTMTAKPINFKLTNFNNKPGASLPFQLSVGFNQKGLIKLDGNAVIQPLSAQIAVDVKDIALENFQAYVDKFARLDVIDGALAVGGKVLV
ncbi:MAG: DUF748 domain-containing protein, partial [Methylobacter sp.]